MLKASRWGWGTLLFSIFFLGGGRENFYFKCSEFCPDFLGRGRGKLDGAVNWGDFCFCLGNMGLRNSSVILDWGVIWVAVSQKWDRGTVYRGPKWLFPLAAIWHGAPSGCFW